jgi:hypothetical protein
MSGQYPVKTAGAQTPVTVAYQVAGTATINGQLLVLPGDTLTQASTGVTLTVTNSWFAIVGDFTTITGTWSGGTGFSGSGTIEWQTYSTSYVSGTFTQITGTFSGGSAFVLTSSITLKSALLSNAALMVATAPACIQKAAGQGVPVGWVTFSSGVNAGVSRPIAFQPTTGAPGYVNGATTIPLAVPFPFTPAVGDAFTVTRGCNKLYGATGDCAAVFSNSAKFGGQPSLPLGPSAASAAWTLTD